MAEFVNASEASRTPTVCLVVLFNHSFAQNLPKLRALYAERFSHIRYLIPFSHHCEDPEVISVYGNSRYFQGFVAQALESLLAVPVDYYLFIADDLLLNPRVTSNNLLEVLGMSRDNDAYLSGFIDLTVQTDNWPRCYEALAWTPNPPGLEVGQFAREFAVLSDASPHSQTNRRVRLRGVIPFPPGVKRTPFPPESQRTGTTFQVNLRSLARDLKTTLRRLPYVLPGKRRLRPSLVGGYSDIFVIRRDALPASAHLFGILASSNLFVELAIPTGLAVCAKRIATEAGATLRGRALWSTADLELLAPYGRDLRRLMDNFPEGYLFLHPIKLSEWEI